MYLFIVIPAQGKSILPDLVPLPGFDYVCNQLHMLTCEVGLKMMPNIELYFQAEVKGE